MNTDIDDVLLKVAIWALLAARNLKWGEPLTWSGREDKFTVIED
jgi:hypothetical protein